MSKALVIPCYNEATRLPLAEVDRLLASTADLDLVFVDDGSTDSTKEILLKLAAGNPRIRALILPQNSGKAEAVRQGLLEALKHRYEWVGYADADFATPASELARLLRVAEEKQPEVLLGSRVLLLGSTIERKHMRHYLGRVFATFASIALDLPVYDTQCGAKVFRAGPQLREVLTTPFSSRWAFDVELLGRLCLQFPNRRLNTFIEVPLLEWRDVQGSKLKFTSMVKAGLDLLTIGLALRRGRRHLSTVKVPT
ncbi:MAG: glycosyltransferase [Bdellovibrionales bacterium]|nr:glycosyltransferase [Bdellovibrionales bacterium]